MIIDFHTHTFPASISLKAIENLGKNGHVAYFTDATTDALTEMMKRSGVNYSVNLPVMTRPDQVTGVNDSLLRRKEALFQEGIITFGGLHPAFDDYRSEIIRLKQAGIKGIKLHPAFQGIHINDISYKRIIDAVSEAGLITVVHCGLDVGFLDQNYASVPELLEIIKDVRPEKFVLAHLGGWQAWDEVEKEIAGADVYLDTAFSLGPVHARQGEEESMPYKTNLSEDDFVRLVRKHGADRILFATDCPWADQKEYIDFVNRTSLTEEEKEKVFSKNAESLLGVLSSMELRDRNV